MPTYAQNTAVSTTASRISLEIVSVHVERLQEISDEDALSEGVKCQGILMDHEPRHQFRVLWDSINGKRGYGWAISPWIWVISFKQV